MVNVMASGPDDLRRVNALLEKNAPHYRRAYSDRTAWFMACLSELSYVRFNPVLSVQGKTRLLDNVSKLIGDNEKSSLLKLINLVGYDHVEERKRLEEELAVMDARLVETFDSDGTQAILVETNEFIVLAFRGTEATSIKDIKTDARARMVACGTGGRIHEGFQAAFGKVALAVQKQLNQESLGTKPLFITGHSLGGALATIAARELSHQGGIAACYTYGSPRVGDDEWVASMKAPVYRLVNAADGVTMLPPSTTLVVALCWLVRRIPYVGEGIGSWLSRFGGYLHCGDMRYLTNCVRGQYGDVRLLYSVSFFYRLKGFVVNQLPWKKFLADHSMSIYRNKLMVVAEKRNPVDGGMSTTGLPPAATGASARPSAESPAFRSSGVNPE